MLFAKNNFKLAFLFFVVLVLILVFSSYLANNSTNNEDSTNFSYPTTVLQGLFIDEQTGEKFTYLDIYGYLPECEKEVCSKVYFDANSETGEIFQIRALDITVNAFGKIENVELVTKNIVYDYKPTTTYLYRTVNYSIRYEFRGKEYTHQHTEDLCHRFKGGSEICYSPAKVGSQVALLVLEEEGKPPIVENVIIFDKMVTAKLLELKEVEIN